MCVMCLTEKNYVFFRVLLESENQLAASNSDRFECHRPKRVYPYHIWLPYGKYTKYYEVSHHSSIEFCYSLENGITPFTE